MTHEEVQELLSAVPRSRMAPEQLQAVDAHLAECGACREAGVFSHQLEEGLRPLRARGTASPAVLGRLHGPYQPVRKLSQRISIRRPGRANPFARFVVRCAAALLMAASGAWVAWLALSQRDEIAQPEDAGGAPVPEVAAEHPAAPNKPKPPRKAPAEPDGQVGEPETPEPTPAPSPALAQTPPVPREAPAPEPRLPDGLLKGTARLRPVQPGAPTEARDSVRLADGALGLDLFESDLRIVKMEAGEGEPARDVLAVSLGGGRDASRLQDLGSPTKPPQTLEASDAFPLEAGRRFLLRTEPRGEIHHFLVTIAEHRLGEAVELEWTYVGPEQATAVIAQAQQTQREAAQPGIPGKRPPGILASPDPRKKKGTEPRP